MTEELWATGKKIKIYLQNGEDVVGRIIKKEGKELKLKVGSQSLSFGMGEIAQIGDL